MDNKTQLQANNARIEALTEILKNKSAGGGSGGLEINGLLKECEAGEALEAGDFVKVQDSVDVTQSVSYGSSSYVPTIQRLEGNKFFVAGNSYTGIILDIADNFTHSQVANTTSIPVSSAVAPYVSIKYDDTKFLVFSGYGSSTSQYIYGAVVEVVNDTITVLKRTQLTTKGYTWSSSYGIEKVSDNKFIVGGTYSNQRQATGYVVEVNPEDYSMTEVKRVASAYSSCSNFMPIDENNYLFVDGKNFNYWYVNLNGSVIKNYWNAQSYSVIHKLVRLDDDNIAMFYTWGDGISPVTSPTRCEVYNVSSNTFTEPVQVSDSALSSMAIKVADNKIQFMSVLGASNVRLTTVTFNGSQVDEVEHKEFSIAPNKFYSYTTTSTPTVVFAELENLNSVLIYAYMDNSKYCKVLLGVPVATKITSASDTLAGVASKKANVGKLLDVYVPNV